EMKCPLNGSVFITVTSVNRVFPYRSCVFFSDGSFSSISRIGSPDQSSKIFNRIFFFKDGSNYRTSGHEFNQFSKERTLLVDCIKSLCISLSHLSLFQRHDPESCRVYHF